MTPIPTEPIRAALTYAQAGWPVFPCHAVNGGRCTCGRECDNRGKHPATRRGCLDATCGAAEIHKWWTNRPRLNVAVATGADAGIIVVDIDPRHGGDASLRALIDEHGPLPETVEAVTGGGGTHYVFAHPGGKVGNRSGIRPGIDTRGDGGYILVAPSNHASGGVYQWRVGHGPTEMKPAAIPSWLLELIRNDRPAPAAESNGHEPHDWRSDAAAIDRARRYIQRLPRAISGQGGHDATFRAACVLVCGFALGEADALALLSEWNVSHCDPQWRDHELAHKIRSAMKQPGERAYLRDAAPKNYDRIVVPDYHEPEVIEPDPPAARESFPVDALPFPMRTIVEAVSDCTQTPPEMAGLAALVTAAGCIGNQAIVRWKRGFDQPAVLWGANISKSGTNKSAPTALITAPLDGRAERIGDEHANMMQSYAADVAQHKVRVEEWKKAGGKGPMPKAPPAPIQERVTTDDFTFERLVTLSAENPRGLAIIVDELGSWALAMNQQRGGRGADLPGFLTAYDARPRTRDRQKPDGDRAHTCIRVPRFALSILGTIQPRVFARLFGQQEREAGLLARLLVIDPPEAYPDLSDDELDEATAVAWGDTLERLLTFNPPADGKIKPLVVNLTVDAKGAFRTWHNDVQAEMRRGIPDDDLRAYYGKLKGVCLRVALAFHCVECTARGDDVAATPISLDTMTRAIRVTEWFRRVAVRVYGALAEDDAERGVRELTEWIGRRGGSVTIRDLRTRFRGDTDAARRAAADLEKRGFGRIERTDTGGRPSERFVLTRATKRSGTPPETSEKQAFGTFGFGISEPESADGWVEA